MSKTFLSDDSSIEPTDNLETNQTTTRTSPTDNQAATADQPAPARRPDEPNREPDNNSGVARAGQAPWGELPEDLKGLAEVKGWQSPADALKSYKHLEEFMGADKAGRGLVLPRDEDDAEAFGVIYDKLGRPEKPEDYGLSEVLKEGEIDENLLSTMARAMHESGLSKRQAQKVAEAYQGQWAALRDAQSARHQAEVEEARGELNPRQQEEARRGFRFLELSQEDAAAIEYYLGVKRAAEVFGKIGRALGEDRAVEGAKTAGGVGSPEAARRRISELNNDAFFRDRYLNGDKEALAEMTRLHKLAAGE